MLGFTCLLCAGLDGVTLAITDGVASFSDQETVQCGSELLWKFVQLNWTGPNEEDFVHRRAKATLVRFVFATFCWLVTKRVARACRNVGTSAA